MATPQTNEEEIFYQSTYVNSVDEKRRVQIPAKWRPQNEEAKFHIIIWGKGDEACLTVYPDPLMKEMIQKVKQLPHGDAKADTLRRRLGGKSDCLPLDKAGRITIPEKYAQVAGIEKDAVLVGMLDKFQIWNPKRFEAADAADNAQNDEAISLI